MYWMDFIWKTPDKAGAPPEQEREDSRTGGVSKNNPKPDKKGFHRAGGKTEKGDAKMEEAWKSGGSSRLYSVQMDSGEAASEA